MRFIEKEDHYLDTHTGLKWSKENFGEMTSFDTSKLHISGWRLPTSQELSSIVDASKRNPTTELPGMRPICYWSSTSYRSNNDYAINISFHSGFDYVTYRSVAYCIRLIKEE